MAVDWCTQNSQRKRKSEKQQKQRKVRPGNEKDKIFI